MKDANAAFAIISNIIMTTSTTVMAIAEETVAEVTMLMKHHREYVEEQTINTEEQVHRHVPDHRQLP